MAGCYFRADCNCQERICFVLFLTLSVENDKRKSKAQNRYFLYIKYKQTLGYTGVIISESKSKKIHTNAIDFCSLRPMVIYGKDCGKKSHNSGSKSDNRHRGGARTEGLKGRS